MAQGILRSPEAERIVARQHDVIARSQLLALGLTRDAIQHGIDSGRLFSHGLGIYAVGRQAITLHGRWMAAALGCGPEAVLSHSSAAALWGFSSPRPGRVEVSVPAPAKRCRPGIVVHRRAGLAQYRTEKDRVPVTKPHLTLVDLATVVPAERLEAAVNEADKLGVIDPETLRTALDRYRGRRGAGVLRALLDRRTFALTDSQLERRFLPLARQAGLERPSTGTWLNGFKVDFHWPDLGLVVETDGLRYHRTAAQQTRDRLRDQAHTAAGLTQLRFPHSQIAYEPAHVVATLRAVAERLELAAGRGEPEGAARTE